jgi:hypothetical protein
MSSTNEQLGRALQILREQHHEVTVNPGAFVGADGRMRVTIDGVGRTFDEIFEMTQAPDDVFRFEAHGEICGELRVYYGYRLVSYEAHQNGKTPEKRKEVPDDESVYELVERTKAIMGATSVQRV